MRRENALAVLRREPELIVPGPVAFVAHALVVPSTDPADIEQHDANVELIGMKITRAFEEAAGAKVTDVHTPELARRAGLSDNPGFDILSLRPDGEKRCIEVKGRAETGDVEISANEWAKACNIRQAYWLYAVYNCATPVPRLVRVQDPFGNLLAKAKSVNMPNDNIDRAIKKGTGEAGSVNYEEVSYEGYAAGGVGLIVKDGGGEG